jgi:hypothetical protein
MPTRWQQTQASDIDLPDARDVSPFRLEDFFGGQPQRATPNTKPDPWPSNAPPLGWSGLDRTDRGASLGATLLSASCGSGPALRPRAKAMAPQSASRQSHTINRGDVCAQPQ